MNCRPMFRRARRQGGVLIAGMCHLHRRRPGKAYPSHEFQQNLRDRYGWSIGTRRMRCPGRLQTTAWIWRLPG